MSGAVAYIIRKIRRPSDIRQVVGILFLIILTIIGQPQGSGMVGLGVLLSIAGIVIRFWAGGFVKKDKELATTGPYAYVRNPLYVGNVLVAFGFCMLSGFIWSYIVFVALYAWLYVPSIKKEERTLNKLFGDEFVRYKENVRAMWPRRTPYNSASGNWSGSQWVRNGEHLVNAGLVTCLFVFIYRYFG